MERCAAGDDLLIYAIGLREFLERVPRVQELGGGKHVELREQEVELIVFNLDRLVARHRLEETAAARDASATT